MCGLIFQIYGYIYILNIKKYYYYLTLLGVYFIYNYLNV